MLMLKADRREWVRYWCNRKVKIRSDHVKITYKNRIHKVISRDSCICSLRRLFIVGRTGKWPEGQTWRAPVYKIQGSRGMDGSPKSGRLQGGLLPGRQCRFW